MNAVVLTGKNIPPVLQSVPDPKAAPGEAIVTLRAAALNHRDVWIQQGMYAGINYPVVPGSDGAGVVTSVGEGVDQAWLNREVVINPSFDWGSSPRAFGERFTILGLPKDGTLAEQINVPAANLAPKPAHLSWDEAAALPLAALTAWRALFTRAQLRVGERVLVTGIGAGTALFALQFAKAAGAEVWVTSGSAEKIAKAKELGAKGGVNYKDADWAKTLSADSGGFDVILDSASGAGFNHLLDVAKPGGRIVFFGATTGPVPELATRKVFWKQLSLLGTTMGSPDDFNGMVATTEQHGIRPVISEVFPLAKAADAFALMARGGQFGKIVLRPE
jgi:NADPH:quinone reductase-like Zn-dependent oxidoreductase